MPRLAHRHRGASALRPAFSVGRKKLAAAAICALICLALFGGTSLVNATDGDLDTSLNPGTGANDGAVYATVLQLDGKLIVGGAFTAVNSTPRVHNAPRTRGARLNAPSLTPGSITFSEPEYSVREGDGVASITLKRTGGADNRVTARVTLSDVTTNPSDYRFKPGAPDLTFGATADFEPFGIILQPNGKLIVGGGFLHINNVLRRRIARLNPDSTLDTSFDPGEGVMDGDVYAMALQSDGKILAGGNFSTVNGAHHREIVRLNSDGSVDASFNPFTDNFGSKVEALVLQPDGKILVGGSFLEVNGAAHNAIVRLNPDGTLDASFAPPALTTDLFWPGIVHAFALQPDGRVVIGGTFTHAGLAPRNNSARLNSDGSLDTTFDPGEREDNPTSGVFSVASQPDGKVLVSGYFVEIDNTPRKHIARLNSDGTLDLSFDPDITGESVNSMTLQPDGKVIIGGSFQTIDGTPRGSIARLNSDGTLDASLDPGTGIEFSGVVLTTALQPDGKVLLGGPFNSVNGLSTSKIARLGGELEVAWADGDSSDKTITLPIVNDSLAEADETLTLSVTQLTGGAAQGANPTATLTIVDDDNPLPTTVSAVSASGVYDGTATLTASLTVGASGVPGKTVSFKLNGDEVGTATTGAGGYVTLSGVSLAGVNAGSYADAVRADFAGDSDYAASFGTGALEVQPEGFTITMTASRNPAPVGQNFNYNVSVTNDGPGTASGATLTDQLPSQVTLTAASASQGSCTYATATRTVTCNFGALASGALATAQLTVKPREEGTLNNTAGVSAPNYAPASASVNSLQAIKYVDLAVQNTGSANPIFAGQNVIYTITVKNINTMINATGVALTDTLPASMTLVSATTSQGSLVTPPVGSTGMVTANLGSIAPNVTATVMVTVKSTAAGVVSNSATATSNESDSNAANNSDNAATVVTMAALQKVLLAEQVLIGGCENTTGNVYLNGPAGPGGMTVPLTTSSLAGVSVPASVFIPAGQSVSPAFNVTTSPVATKQVGLVVAGSGQGAGSRGLTINVGSGSCQ